MSYQVKEIEIAHKLTFLVKFIISTVHAEGQGHFYIRDNLFKTKQHSFLRVCGKKRFLKVKGH